MIRTSDRVRSDSEFCARFLPLEVGIFNDLFTGSITLDALKSASPNGPQAVARFAVDRSPPEVSVIETGPRLSGPFRGAFNSAPIWVRNKIFQDDFIEGLEFIVEDKTAISRIILDDADLDPQSRYLDQPYAPFKPSELVKAAVLPEGPVRATPGGAPARDQGYALVALDYAGHGTTVYFNIDSTPPAIDYSVSVTPQLGLYAVGAATDAGSGMLGVSVVPDNPLPTAGPSAPQGPLSLAFTGQDKPLSPQGMGPGPEPFQNQFFAEPPRFLTPVDVSGLTSDLNVIQVYRNRQREGVDTAGPKANGGWFKLGGLSSAGAYPAFGFRLTKFLTNFLGEGTGVRVWVRAAQPTTTEAGHAKTIYPVADTPETLVFALSNGTITKDLTPLTLAPQAEMRLEAFADSPDFAQTAPFGHLVYEFENADGFALLNYRGVRLDAGLNIAVSVEGARVELGQVQAGPDNRIGSMAGLSGPPAQGYRCLPGVQNCVTEIFTTAGYQGPVKVTLPFNPAGLPEGLASQARLFHYDAGWKDITTSVDPAGSVTGVAPHLSLFGVFISTAKADAQV